LLEEIPSEAELAEILKRYDDSVIGAWHDTGHAHVRELLGVTTQEQMLEAAGDRLLGMHIHDVDAYAEDHRPPGLGDVLFERIKAFVRPETIKVFEFSPKWHTDDVLKGVAHVKELWSA
jgi:sugar phosphate isomerase/epimerase